MKQRSYHLWITGGIFLLYQATTSSTQAQIIPDGTTPTLPAVCSAICEITGGTKAGNNLFHSFSLFNVDVNQKVSFLDPGVTNIVSRVTGNNHSDILGTLGVSGSANLFLINPNGIIFGPDARLNVNGSFVATTANAIQFGNQGFFSASSPNAPGLLTVAPSAFLFNQIAAQPINSIEIGNGAFLSAGSLENPGSLLLVGGNVSPSIASTGRIMIDGGTLKVTGGRVELGGVAGSGTVGLNVDGKNLRLSFPDSVAQADVSLLNKAFVDVSASSGGSVAINARNLSLASNSSISSNTQQGDGGGIYINTGTLTLDNSQIQSRISGEGRAGSVIIDARDTVSIAESSIYSITVEKGNGGDIHINTGTLFLTANAGLIANTYGAGNAGAVFVQANRSVSIEKGSSISTGGESQTVSVGNGGDIKIQTGTLLLTDNSILETSTSGKERAGNVIIDARDTVSLEKNSFIFSDTFGLGNGGIISIRARALSLTNGAELLSSTTGKGNAGDIQINASDFVRISGVNLEDGFSSGLFTTTEAEAVGQSGNIKVTTGALRVSDGAVLSTRTRSAFRGGNITVDVNTLEVTNGGQLLTTAFNSGDAGSITVEATDSVTLSGSDPIFTNRLALFGPVNVDPDSPASGLSARVEGDKAANAGKIEVTAGSIHLDNQGTITAETTLGQGGNIILKAGDILLRNNSTVSATAGTTDAGGDGGNINIDTDLLLALENSDITANAFEDEGGFIKITAQGIFGLEVREEFTDNSDITAFSRNDPSLNGKVEINTPDVDPSSGLVALPAELVDVTELIAQGCSAGGGNVATLSKFIVTGRGGLPPTPTEALRSDPALADLGTPVQGEENRARAATSINPTSSEPAPIIEAQGWVIGDNGEVVLTAQAPTFTPHIPWLTPTSCHGS